MSKARRKQKTQTPAPPSQLERMLRRGIIGSSVLFAALFAGGLVTSIHSLQSPTAALVATTIHDPSATQQLRVLGAQVNSLETAEQVTETQVVPNATLEQQLSQIQISIEIGKHREAVAAMDRLAEQVADDRSQLSQRSLAASSITADNGSLNVPIVFYHKTPADFAAQLNILQQKGYHTITMAQLAAALHGRGSLPTKPVGITFDDGFADQMTAFSILQRHHMVATYYIIDGGSASRWCIGAGRRYGDPLQPPTGCGDAYLNWDQIRQLDRSGTITIASHTVDHDNLASDSAAKQQYEIIQGKRELEAQLGHPVHDFAYPYGSFNAATVSVVRQAGFATAVTTMPGTSQSLASIYTLRRVRDPRLLP